MGAGRGRVGVVKALGEGVMEDGQAPEVGRGRAPGPWAEGRAAPAAPRPQLCSRRPPPRDHRGSLHGASRTTDFPPLARPITPATRLWSQVHPTAVTSGGTSRSPLRLLPRHLQDQTRHGHHKGPRGPAPAPAQLTATSSAADRQREKTGLFSTCKGRSPGLAGARVPGPCRLAPSSLLTGEMPWSPAQPVTVPGPPSLRWRGRARVHGARAAAGPLTEWGANTAVCSPSAHVCLHASPKRNCFCTISKNLREEGK